MDDNNGVPAVLTDGGTGEVRDITVDLDIDAVADAVVRKQKEKKRGNGLKLEKDRDFLMVWPDKIIPLRLNPTEVQVLYWLARRMDEFGIARSTIREMRDNIGVAYTTVWRALDHLDELGVIIRMSAMVNGINPHIIWSGSLADRTVARLKWDGHLAGGPGRKL